MHYADVDLGLASLGTNRRENFFVIVRPSGTVHSRPHKIFLHFHDLWTLLNKIREGVALSPLSILHKTH